MNALVCNLLSRSLPASAKRRLKRQMQAIKAKGHGFDKDPHHLQFHLLEAHLDPDRDPVKAHAASLGS